MYAFDFVPVVVVASYPGSSPLFGMGRSLGMRLLLSHNSDSQSVNRLPKSVVVLLFAVVICVLFIAVAML